jgi:hypothetical protein
MCSLALNTHWDKEEGFASDFAADQRPPAQLDTAIKIALGVESTGIKWSQNAWHGTAVLQCVSVTCCRQPLRLQGVSVTFKVWVLPSRCECYLQGVSVPFKVWVSPVAGSPFAFKVSAQPDASKVCVNGSRSSSLHSFRPVSIYNHWREKFGEGNGRWVCLLW